MRKYIPYGKQKIGISEIWEVLKTLKSEWLTQGPLVRRFEKKVEKKVECRHAVAVNSATSALHISCLSLGLREKEWVWTVPISFVASANCAKYCNAKVDFVDIDINTGLIDTKKLEKKLIQAKKERKLPKIVIPVHLTGASCDMKEINRLSKVYDFKIIEDASHAIGGKYKETKIGSCEYSDITVFSFHPVKIITTGEGGVATTNNTEINKKLKLLRSHGISKDKGEFIGQCREEWYYEQQLLGYNYRMTDIAASLGIAQINKLDGFVMKRRRIKDKYIQELRGLKCKVIQDSDQNKSSVHLVTLMLDDKIKHYRDQIVKNLRDMNIGTQVHYYPIHLQPYYRNLGYKEGDFKEAENYAKRVLSLPVYPHLKKSQQRYIIKTLQGILRKIQEE